MLNKQVSKIRKKKNSKIERIEVDHDLCIGVGTCEVLAPEMFKLDEKGKAYISNPDSRSDDEVLDAARSCPVFAIKIFDKRGKQIYPQ